jgi:hypothetical protein
MLQPGEKIDRFVIYMLVDAAEPPKKEQSSSNRCSDAKPET